MNERLEEIKRRIEGFNDEQNYFRDMKWLIGIIEKQQKEILQLKGEVQGWKSQVLTAKGWFDK